MRKAIKLSITIISFVFSLSSCSNSSDKKENISENNHSIMSETSIHFDALNEIKKTRKINIAFLVFDQIEPMDLNGPIDVFTKVNGDKIFNLYTVSASTERLAPLEGETFFMRTTYSFENAPQADILIVPGANDQVIKDICENQSELIDWIVKQNKQTSITMSICTGAAILGKAGLLEGKQATTHAFLFDLLKPYKDVSIVEGVRFVEDGKIITTAGITSGLDGALYAIERIKGKEEADLIAKILIYDRNGNLDFLANSK